MTGGGQRIIVRPETTILEAANTISTGAKQAVK